jgi:hypothetical protein
MTDANGEHGQKVIKVVQELLQDEDDKGAITASLIESKIQLVLAMNPKWGVDLDRSAVTDELIRRFSLWIGQDTTIQSIEDHVHWLSAGRKRNWRYWQRYREWLERSLSPKAVEGLDRSTDKVLGLLEDPTREGTWSRRGLVVGHVQSGKTGNYTALISKAADAGYKIIIVLAGLHNNLRAQTQIRLDEGFLGYETRPVPDDIRVIGVGEIDGDPTIRPNYATNRSEKGDFSTAVARNLGITPEQRPWLFVVKKNKTVLERLYRWIRNHVANTHDAATGRKLVTHLPLLLVDDEADHASVDTGEQVFDSDGKPDDEHQPTAINSRIRKILHSFSRSAYVGYTATPFANIFIHERGSTIEEGPDLFPSAFIINLAAPSNYVGPARVFGHPAQGERQGKLPLFRPVADHTREDGKSGWMPSRHKSVHVPRIDNPDGMPRSLVEAIDAFVLTCAVRQQRGQGQAHCSMLVHVTRFNAVQMHVQTAVEAHINRMAQRLRRGIGHEPLLARLKELWERDFEPTTEALGSEAGVGDVQPLPSWTAVEQSLADVVPDIQVRTINGTAKDALDYVEHAGTGLKVIAIGGDKLARGLTLEGLTVSYFLRASRMYDTLMQMGRWFGYRPGYLDLCRLYTTSELVTWFEHITDAAEELRDEFELMAASGATPRDYGLRVQSHPVLMVTSRLKMRSAKNLMISFSGQLMETVSLYDDPQILRQNLAALSTLVSSLGEPEVNPVRNREGREFNWSGFLWRNARASEVVDFLASYRTHPDAHKVNSALLAEFVQGMSASGELSDWSVAVIGASDAPEDRQIDLADGLKVKMVRRRKDDPEASGYAIGRLLSPRDESIDVDDATWSAALALTRSSWRQDPARFGKTAEPDQPSGTALRRVRGFGYEHVAANPSRGLLMLYVLDPGYEDAKLPPGTPPVVAFGISFPASESGVKVEYKVNNVLWEQEYGPAD